MNVLLITVDALRADHMPWLGYERQVAPNLTRLAEQSVVYTRAYAVSSYTAMSVAGMLAGRYPGELARSGSFFSAYPDEVVFFPELLRQTGVRTLAAQAHFYFDQKAGFRQGFDDYRMVEGIEANNKTDNNVTSPQQLELALTMLSDPNNVGGQFFAWFHFMDPHDVYVKHPGGTDFGRRALDRYDGEIHFTDEHLGRLLAFVEVQPWAAHTAIIVSSDHGEAFGEHQQTRHGFEIWENLVRVPLLVRIPGVAPRRIDLARSAIDVAPTVLELLGAPAPSTFQGKSLLGELRGTEPPEPREVVVDLPRTSDNDRRRALVWDRHKIISFGDDFRYELYDVVADPGETRDLRKQDDALYDAMRQRYKKRSEAIRDVCPKRRDFLKGKRAEREC